MAMRRLSCVLRTLPRSGSRCLSTGTPLQNPGPGSKAEQLGLSSEPNTAAMFTEEHEQLCNSLKKLIDTEINPYVDEWEEAGQFPVHEVFKKLGDAGILGITKEPKYGGLGLDYTYALAVAETLGNINCGGIPMAVGVQTDMATPALAKHGSDRLKEEFLRPAIAGDMVTCIGVSEPSAGSDVAGIKTRVSRKGDDLIINGSKMWITNGMTGDWMCMLANSGEGAMHQNKSLIVVPLNLPGVHRVRNIEKLGMHCSDTAELHFDDVRVPDYHIIGNEKSGFMHQMEQFQLERLYGTAVVLAPLDRMIKDVIEYTSQRKVFGMPLIFNQSIHFRLAELQCETEALRSMVYRAVGKFVAGEDVTYLASMCKLKGGRLAREVSDSCLQYYGGMGYTKEMLISRLYRDLRLLSIGGGADEVMLGIICKYMGTLPSMKKQKS